jgi:hypothetical protein
MPIRLQVNEPSGDVPVQHTADGPLAGHAAIAARPRRQRALPWILMTANALSLLAAFVVARLLVDANGSGAAEQLALLPALPLWFAGAGLAGFHRTDCGVRANPLARSRPSRSAPNPVELLQVRATT